MRSVGKTGIPELNKDTFGFGVDAPAMPPQPETLGLAAPITVAPFFCLKELAGCIVFRDTLCGMNCVAGAGICLSTPCTSSGTGIL